MHLSILCLTTIPPPRQYKGRNGDLNYANSNALPIEHASQSNPNLLPTQRIDSKRWPLLLLIIAHGCGEQSRVPHVWDKFARTSFECQNRSNPPPFPLRSLGGVVGHNIDRCNIADINLCN